MPSLSQGILAAAAASLGASTAAAQNATYLTATAIVTDTARNASALQCWEFTTPLDVPTTPGIAGALRFQFNLSSAVEYAAIPPRFDGGLHNAPQNQFVVFASGLAHITLPNSTDEAWILGGENGLIVAVDTMGSGHFTTYPTDQTTISFALPFLNGEPPAHKVRSEGACHGNTQLVPN
ncbi:hypothetical protein B0J12DRAFT_672714 [Macrophomina phaseolina]|uniref:Uncharacterized protein n=1 Tax=Macrophomina phaseolina TaxID=35725 RepID=A0ABQ8G372_9PEZI|nr:hypothetical protein B0J12DRAFT_672714 [Macrophomina phaseolina]